MNDREILLRKQISVAKGDTPADLVLKNGQSLMCFRRN